MKANCIKVTDLPVVEYGHEQITQDELVALIGKDVAADLMDRLEGRGWIVDRYEVSGLWLWIDLSQELDGPPIIRHYYGD